MARDNRKEKKNGENKPTLTRVNAELWLKDLDYTQGKAAAFMRLGHFDTAAFYLHLAVEKSFKAAIAAFKGQEPPKTHNLKRLYSEVADCITLTDEQVAFLDELTPVVSKTRYMDATLELMDEVYTEDIVKAYFDKAVPIIELVKSCIKEKRS